VIAIVVDNYEQAVPYLALAGSLDERYVVVARLADITGALEGAAFLGGSEEVRRRVRDLLEHYAAAGATGA
jgi:hypothetical protein